MMLLSHYTECIQSVIGLFKGTLKYLPFALLISFSVSAVPITEAPQKSLNNPLPTPTTVIQGEKDKSNAKQENTNPTTSIKNCCGVTLPDWITAISTLILALVTLGILFISIKQLRAYLTATGGRLYYIEGHTLRGEVNILNSGTTIAHKMRWAMDGKVIDAHTTTDFPDLEFRPWIMTLAPRNEWMIGHEFIDPMITKEDLDDICADRKWVYVWGKVEYKDIIGRTHSVKFRYRNVMKKLQFIEGQQRITHWEWFPEAEGNEAT